jgi:hypothetical protein
MTMNEAVDNVLKGLVLHFLHRKTIVDAIAQARSGGVPVELYESLPRIMSEITAAAKDVVAGVRTLDEVVDGISRRESSNAAERKATRMNVARLMHVALTFMSELGADGASDRPLPEMSVPWFRYVPTSGQQED